ncbi:hypothetical protein PG996_003890 [Apiospora saccharicola]|uniref:Nephrocystin 3-like N-terminal domain-containing protein n=1 Tax=Apiospora saccharicola TaxID=335842 RepID=A0ABR1W5I8_9PEZI
MIHEQEHGYAHMLADEFKRTDHKGRTPNAVLAQEKRIRDRLLQSMLFRNMTDREQRISKAHQRTFEWIFGDTMPGSVPWSSFKEFLQNHNKKIYWITGKPGSGKSTLMKYIRQSLMTTGLLQAWGSSDEIVLAAFHFWSSGSRMQMSIEGLLQTVLYNCLRQDPQTLQEVLPERWEAATLFESDDYP